jgi:hypothetical protein
MVYREDVRAGWRKINNEKVHNLYPSSNIIRVIKSRRMKQAEHVACMGGEKKSRQNFSPKT